jgi:hypothetical protein
VRVEFNISSDTCKSRFDLVDVNICSLDFHDLFKKLLDVEPRIPSAKDADGTTPQQLNSQQPASLAHNALIIRRVSS